MWAGGGCGIDNAGKVVCSAYLEGGEDEAEGRSRFASGLSGMQETLEQNPLTPETISKIPNHVRNAENFGTF